MTVTRRSLRLARTVSSAASSGSSYDAIVVGLGAHGSAALYNLAKWGDRALGIERWAPGHDHASHHGLTRITRTAYQESPHYVPLLQKSFQLYTELERESKQTLFHPTGVLNIGGDLFGGALAAAREHGLPHEVLDGAQASECFPAFQLPAGTRVLHEAQGGILEPEKMVAAHCSVAQHHGATVHTGEKVLSWRAEGRGGGVVVETDRGSYRAAKLILAAGAWMDQLVPELRGHATAVRVTVAWFDIQLAARPAFQPSRLPVFMASDEASGAHYYGFPEFGGEPGAKFGLWPMPAGERAAAGLKLGLMAEGTGAAVDPDAQDKARLHPQEEQLLRSFLARHMPGANGRLLRHGVCMFTNTSDGHFIIDQHPRHPQVLLCSACSGHGFKLSPAVGRVLADMARNEGRCAEFEPQLAMHKLGGGRPGHDELLRRFG